MSDLSVAQPIRRFTKLILSPLRVPGGRVQILVAEDLGQTHKIILIVSQELVGHRVPQQMRVNLEAANRTVFVAQISDTPICQLSPLTNEDIG